MSKRKKENQRIVNTISMSSELYNDGIAQEALSRAGDCPQLKGIIHEMLYRDKLNLTSENLIQGNVTKLTKNPTAHDVDLVTLNKNGRPIAKYQLKDCTSHSGTNKTLNQIRSDKYKRTKLMGTEETVQKYNKAKLPSDKNMESTEISSNRTGRIADNAGVKQPDTNTLLNNLKDIGKCAGASAVMGGGVAAASTIYHEHFNYRNGQITGKEYAKKVICNTSKAAATTGATTAAALALKEGGKVLGKKLGSESFKRVAGSNVGTAVAFGVAELGIDAVKLAKGNINASEFGCKATATVGGAAGGLGGATVGAAIGTLVCPGVGTAIGASLGGIAGGTCGRKLCSVIGKRLFGR